MDSSTLYKLMILYMLSKIDSTLTNTQISDFFISKEYTGYFTIQQILDDMISENYIRSSSYYNASHYSITPLGKETLVLLDRQLSFTIKTDINEYISNNKYDFKMNNNVTAECKVDHNGDHIAHLCAFDGSTTLIDLSISCVNEEQAKSFCVKWKDASYDIFSSIVKKLS